MKNPRNVQGSILNARHKNNTNPLLQKLIGQHDFLQQQIEAQPLPSFYPQPLYHYLSDQATSQRNY